MTSEIMWTSTELVYREDGELDGWEQFAQILLDADVAENKIRQEAMDRGFDPECFVQMEEAMCKSLLSFFESYCDKYRVAKYPGYSFILHPKYLKGVYVKKEIE